MTAKLRFYALPMPEKQQFAIFLAIYNFRKAVDYGINGCQEISGKNVAFGLTV